MATTTAKVLSIRQIAWQTKALQLAEERHTIGTPRYIGTNDYGAQLWQVPSRTHDGCYVVTAWEDGTYTCGCTAGSYARPCCHVGASIKAEEQRTAVSTGPSEAWRYWLNGGEW